MAHQNVDRNKKLEKKIIFQIDIPGKQINNIFFPVYSINASR